MVLRFFSLCLGSQSFLQGVGWQFILLLFPKCGWGMDRLNREVSTQSAAAAPGLVEPVVSVLERRHSRTAVLRTSSWTRLTQVTWLLQTRVCWTHFQLKQCPLAWHKNQGSEADCIVITEASTGGWVPVSGLPGATLSNHCGNFLSYAMVFGGAATNHLPSLTASSVSSLLPEVRRDRRG